MTEDLQTEKLEINQTVINDRLDSLEGSVDMTFSTIRYVRSLNDLIQKQGTPISEQQQKEIVNSIVKAEKYINQSLSEMNHAREIINDLLN